jgi:hypothetical protein
VNRNGPNKKDIKNSLELKRKQHPAISQGRNTGSECAPLTAEFIKVNDSWPDHSCPNRRPDACPDLWRIGDPDSRRWATLS